MQSTPQLTPAGALLTVPLPVPLFATASVNCCTKVATTLRAADIVTTQVPVPVQSPLQPAKRVPAPALAVSVTLVPEA